MKIKQICCYQIDLPRYMLEMNQDLARANEELEKKFNSAVFPGGQGGPLMHVIAAKAVSFLEALQPEFVDYQKQVVDNARAMAATFIERGIRIVSGGTRGLSCRRFSRSPGG